jgi:two-component system sensor histidine kinase UhpB
MDIRLDGNLDGIQAAQKIQADGGPPTIFLTAYADEELLERAKLAEPYGYLVKPVHERELRSTIEMALFKHQMDRRLRDSEEKFRTLAETISTAILIFQDGCCVYANPAAERISGYPIEELLGMDYRALLNPEDHQPAMWESNDRDPGEEWTGNRTLRILNSRGEECWLDVARERFQYQGKPANVVTANDITERIRVERALNRSREELQALARYLQTVREDERTNIAHEIHDEFGQALTAIKLELHWIAEMHKAESQIKENLASVVSLTDTAIDMVRRVASELRPGLLDDLGLEAALKWQAQDFEDRAHIGCSLRWEAGNLDLNREITTALFRIFQESLTNVARHSEASHVNASLLIVKGWLVMTITDNGRGITHDELADHTSMGLLGMRERARALGGDLDISGEPGKGTTVQARIPMDPSEDRFKLDGNILHD